MGGGGEYPESQTGGRLKWHARPVGDIQAEGMLRRRGDRIRQKPALAIRAEGLAYEWGSSGQAVPTAL